MSQKSFKVRHWAIVLAETKRGVHVTMKEIPLTQGKVALVDDEDFHFIDQFKWCACKNYNTFYAYRHWNRNGFFTKQAMHNLILNPASGLQTDHIDGNGLNNQKSNLRTVTVRENAQNRHMQKSSRFPGVHWCNNKWRARILVGKVREHLGYFDTEEDAHARYQKEYESLKIKGMT